MLLADIYDDLTLDRFIGYCIDRDKMDIASFRGILRDYNAGILELPGLGTSSPDVGAGMLYREDDPALTRNCSYYEENTTAEVRI